MITKEQLSPLLLEACPEFYLQWQEHLAWWGDGPRGAFNDASEFSHFVVELYGLNETRHFPAIFGQIENFLTDGDDEVKGVATYGYLEDIQNISSHRPHGMDVFTPWLGPKSLKAWNHLKTVWAEKSSLMDVVRSELKNTEGGA